MCTNGSRICYWKNFLFDLNFSRTQISARIQPYSVKMVSLGDSLHCPWSLIRLHSEHKATVCDLTSTFRTLACTRYARNQNKTSLGPRRQLVWQVNSSVMCTCNLSASAEKGEHRDRSALCTNKECYLRSWKVELTSMHIVVMSNPLDTGNKFFKNKDYREETRV